ncbi:MAG: glycosyltransferase [bacterium]|nr:glycosyltransferase [bacterium]
MKELQRDIIILSANRWDQPNAGPSVALAMELSKTRRVFFVDRPFSIKDLFLDYESYSLKKRLPAILFRKKPFIEVQTGFSSFVVATPGLSLPINFLPSGKLFSLFNSLNNWVVKTCINRMIRKYNIADYIYLNYYYPVILPTLKVRQAINHGNIYYNAQDIRLSKYMSRHGEAAEKKAIKKADLILVSSKNQFKRLFKQSANMHYFPNAVDFEMFKLAHQNDIPAPYDLMNIRATKVIMFCGYVSEIRMDYKLLKLVCESFKNCLVVVIGTYEENDLIKHKLDTFANLILLGNRRHEAIPSYLKCAHVAIIPYLCNELNKSVYPLKLNEYLAMGKPVVTTHFSSDLDSFAEVIYIASTYQSFLNFIEQAITEDNEVRIVNRINVAAQNNWGKRATHLGHLLKERLK